MDDHWNRFIGSSSRFHSFWIKALTLLFVIVLILIKTRHFFAIWVFVNCFDYVLFLIDFQFFHWLHLSFLHVFVILPVVDGSLLLLASFVWYFWFLFLIASGFIFQQLNDNYLFLMCCSAGFSLLALYLLFLKLSLVSLMLKFGGCFCFVLFSNWAVSLWHSYLQCLSNMDLIVDIFWWNIIIYNICNININFCKKEMKLTMNYK